MFDSTASKYHKTFGIILLILTLMISFTCLTSCVYDPPEGYTKKHHTYDEILEFALSLDPNAEVSEIYTDTQIDEWNRCFREWDAVINGIPCHVSSVGDMVWNTGICAGEFVKQYYVIDTDYDYLLLKKIVSEKQPEWKMAASDIGARYSWHDILGVDTNYKEKRQLSVEELENVWVEALEIYNEYNSYPVRKEASFHVLAPASYSQSNGENRYLRYSICGFSDFSDGGKESFFEDYTKAWDLLDSDLPIIDE